MTNPAAKTGHTDAGTARQSSSRPRGFRVTDVTAGATAGTEKKITDDDIAFCFCLERVKCGEEKEQEAMCGYHLRGADVCPQAWEMHEPPEGSRMDKPFS